MRKRGKISSKGGGREGGREGAERGDCIRYKEPAKELW